MNVEQIINFYDKTKEILWDEIEILPATDQTRVLKNIFKREGYGPDAAKLIVELEDRKVPADVMKRAISALNDYWAHKR